MDPGTIDKKGKVKGYWDKNQGRCLLSKKKWKTKQTLMIDDSTEHTVRQKPKQEDSIT